MADHRNQKSSYKNRDMGPTYDVYDEDPLVELARIVSEEGGYLNISSDNEDVPASRSRTERQQDAEYRQTDHGQKDYRQADYGQADYGQTDAEDESVLNLENQLIEELEISMAPPSQPADAYRADETIVEEPFDVGALDDVAYGTETLADETDESEPYGEDESYVDSGDQFVDDTVYAAENEPDPVEVSPEHVGFDSDQFDPHQAQAHFTHNDDPGLTYDEPALAGDVSDLLSEQELSELEQALSEVDQFDDEGAGAQFDDRMEVAASGEFDEFTDDIDDIDELDDNLYAIPPAMPVGAPLEDVESDRGRGSGRKIFAIAAVLSIAVLGGGVFAMMSSTSNNQVASAPPLFRAGEDPLKVEPDSGSDIASDEKSTIFDAASMEADPAREELVERSEVPVDRIAALNGDQLSNGTGSGSASDLKDMARLGGETGSGTAAPRMEPIGPKQVTTVKVNADGTIIRPSLDETGPSVEVDEEPIIVGGLPDPVKDTRTAAVTVDESRPVAVQVVDIKPTAPGADASIGGDDIARTQASGLGAIAGGQDDGSPIPRVRPDEVPATQVARVQPSRASDLVAQPSQQGSSGPVNLLDSNTNARRPSSPAAAPQSTGSTNSGSGYLVQLSAQRSEDQALAAFNGMKAQFPSLLGNYQPSIQRADLGERGIYYRVRVGPMASQGAANDFCEQLKSSGGNCFVTR